MLVSVTVFCLPTGVHRQTNHVSKCLSLDGCPLLTLWHRHRGLKTSGFPQTWIKADGGKRVKSNSSVCSQFLFPIPPGFHRFTGFYVLAVEESGFQMAVFVRSVFVETVLQSCWFNAEAICETVAVLSFIVFGLIVHVCVCVQRGFIDSLINFLSSFIYVL